jgi:hypothetical protein
VEWIPNQHRNYRGTTDRGRGQRTTFARISRKIGALLSRAWDLLKQREGLRREGHNVAVYGDETGGAQSR